MKTLIAITLLVSLAGCAGQNYQPGGDHSLATADQTMGPRNHASATRGIYAPPNTYAPDNGF